MRRGDCMRDPIPLPLEVSITCFAFLSQNKVEFAKSASALIFKNSHVAND